MVKECITEVIFINSNELISIQMFTQTLQFLYFKRKIDNEFDVQYFSENNHGF